MGIAIGLAGIVMLNSGGNLSGNPWGAILILIGSISWAFGSVYGSRITLPTGMMAGAIEMLAAGIVLMCASLISGEKLTTLPSLSGFLAVGYLAVFGSIIAINAYMYLIRNVSPALATSYAYVNPVVAVLLGTGLGGERLALIEWLALGVIVFAVVLVTLGKYLFPANRRSNPWKTKNVTVNVSPEYRSARMRHRRRSTLQDVQTARRRRASPAPATRIPRRSAPSSPVPPNAGYPGDRARRFTDLIQPEFCARGRHLKQVAMMVMPETTVGKNHAAVFIQYKIGTSRNESS